jgi:hypothetical protein
MRTAGQPSTSRIVVSLLALTTAGCIMSETDPQSLSVAERAAIADTIERLSRQRPDSAAVASVDCDELERRGRAALPQALEGRNAPGFSVVSEGRIYGTSSNEELAESCRWNRNVREARLSTQAEILDQQIHVISRDAAYELISIRETIHWKDGRTTIRPMVITRIWSRGSDGWMRAHVHESWPVGEGR